ncbi:bifunctional DNA primase/polymerase [Micromonospora sp. WMMD1102]|uniref:bifunctional DNA primase/polymerase n=1 Tax=Micromonospora sp. WMMD1102 TaxID=3016105 RepID=UPI0024159059|nr:bifunctional DNA primase/polymerase [Micromonospora sp. WMMD1102]MDG4790015.1 bifunctional DNA primase/polymerase [Micromonospora sp. WMMD1102]
MPDNRLTTALDYAARGWPVFLLGRSKRPMANCPACRTVGTDHDREACPCLTCHGFYAATRDPDRIAAMLTAHPSGLLAVRTGAVSGLVVVDIDPRHGGRLVPALMPPTAAVATGSGGWHLYYRHPGTPVLSRPLPGRTGIDIKADGGYVVAPPSIHPDTGRPYRWARHGSVEEMPPALRAAVLTPPADLTPATRPHQPITREAGGISSPTALLAAHLDAVRRAPEGRRRTTLYGAARGVARMVAAGALTPADAWTALAEAGRAAEQTDRDIRAAVRGGFQAEGVAA